jgi:peroxiredoxin
MSDRLAAGDTAPDFTLTSDTEEQVSLSDLRGKKVILYFYPAAMTPGCTKQACDFSDSLDSLRGAGYEVLGVSKDKPAKLAKFRERDALTLTLLSDEDLAVHRVDLRDRRGGQGRARPVQRQGHRPRREAAPGPRVGLSTTLSVGVRSVPTWGHDAATPRSC